MNPVARLSLVLLAAMPASAPAATADVALVHGFGSHADDGPPDLELVVHGRVGDVRPGGSSGKEPIDLADYSDVVRLTVRRSLLAGPADPPILLPEGLYSGDLLPAAGGGLRLVLHGPGGLRMALPLGPATVPHAAPRGATAQGSAEPGDAFVVTMDLPTASGTLVLALAGSTGSGAGPGRRPTRTETIRKELRDRRLRSGRPARRTRRTP